MFFDEADWDVTGLHICGNLVGGDFFVDKDFFIDYKDEHKQYYCIVKLYNIW